MPQSPDDCKNKHIYIYNLVANILPHFIILKETSPYTDNEFFHISCVMENMDTTKAK